VPVHQYLPPPSCYHLATFINSTSSSSAWSGHQHQKYSRVDPAAFLALPLPGLHLALLWCVLHRRHISRMKRRKISARYICHTTVSAVLCVQSRSSCASNLAVAQAFGQVDEMRRLVEWRCHHFNCNWRATCLPVVRQWKLAADYFLGQSTIWSFSGVGKLQSCVCLAVTWKSGKTTFISFNPGKPIAIFIFCTADSMLANNYYFQFEHMATRKIIRNINCNTKSSETACSNSIKLCIFHRQYVKCCKVVPFSSITWTSHLNDLYIYTNSLAVSFRY
jgi:hypothetical protein